MSHYDWTPEVEAWVFDAARQGLTAHQIAVRLPPDSRGRIPSRNAVTGKLFRARHAPSGAASGPAASAISGTQPPVPVRARKPKKLGATIVRNGAVPLMRVVAKGAAQKPAKAGKQAGIPLLELRDKQCRWPVTDLDSYGKYLFCGEVCVTGSSYCQEHEHRSWNSRACARDEDQAA